MDSQNQNAELPPAPEFLITAVNKAKIAGNKALQTGEPIGKTVELICNTLVEEIGNQGMGFCSNEFGPMFLAQAKDNGLMRQTLAAIMVKINTDGSFTDADALKLVLQTLSPLPS